MEFNANKCYILSVRPKTDYYYQLNSTILKGVPNNPYLGIHISADLKWRTHIDTICKRASSTLGFLRRNLRHSPTMMRKTAYIALIISSLEYGAIIWDPFLQSNIDKIEKLQRKAARFISGDYRSRDPGCVTRMLQDNDIVPLHERRKYLRLTFLYKVVEGLVPALPHHQFVNKTRSRKNVSTRKYRDYVTCDTLDNIQVNSTRGFQARQSNTDIYTHLFFPRIIRDWNLLPESTVTSASVEAFKTSLQRD
jgi:hypothetical protein